MCFPVDTRQEKNKFMAEVWSSMTPSNKSSLAGERQRPNFAKWVEKWNQDARVEEGIRPKSEKQLDDYFKGVESSAV